MNIRARLSPLDKDGDEAETDLAQSGAASAARILIVDDDERNLLALAEVLRDIADVVSASSGEQALRCLLKEQFAVIILDVLMPDMDGYETARLIRTREQSRDTPIIFLTAINKEDAHLLRGYDSGAVDYVFKPLQPLIVRSKVSVFVSLYQKTREIEEKAVLQQELLRERLEAEQERTRAVEHLREVEEFNELLLRSLPLALYTAEAGATTLTRQFVAGNIVALTGYETDVLRPESRLWDDRIHIEDRVRANHPVFGERSVEFRWQHADGSYRYFLDQAIPLADGRHIAGSVRDVTEQHQLQEQLLQAQKLDALGKLTGGIAHDFNNLLASVLGGLNLIEHRAKLDGNSAQILEMTRHAALQGKELIDRMLAFSRRQSLVPRTVSLHDVKGALEAMLAPVLGGLVVLNWDLADDVWPVFVDQSQLELALMNLIINARDAMPGGGTITIRAANHSAGIGKLDLADGNYVKLSIVDTGRGIPPELLDKVMEPFFTTKDVGKGTGLGLSTAYGFARQSGGTLQLRSAVGTGTTVELWLPRAREAGGAVAVEPRHEVGRQKQALRGRRVLLVDDASAVREVTRAQLADEGLDVTVAADGSEALSLIEGAPEPFDVIVTDFAMPAVSGLDVINFARSVRSGYPAILITGYADQDVLMNRPADVPLLHKPCDRTILIGAILAALQ
ncbi:MAG TPA: response regulator [Devosia sp.]|nr:response regulator [Devosia sp.]